MLTMPAFMAGVQSADAAVTNWDTYFFVMLSPNPVGVGQTMLITLQVDKVNPLATMTTNNWEGFICKITKPDGTTETKGPFTTYSMGNIWFSYTPTQAGTYTFEGSWPGQWVNGSYTSISTSFGNWVNGTGTRIYENRWYKPSSASATLTVQSAAVPTIPDIPLPTEPWTRPISGENKGWYHIADNWLMLSYDINSRRFSATAYAPYTSAPKSPHILWKQPVTFGGIIGGSYGDQTYYTGLSYEAFYLPLILNGRIIYTVHGPTGSSVYGTRCISLYTGEDIWYLDDVNIAFAQVLEYDSGNEHGGLAYLWETSGSTWYMYDAFEGRQILTVANVTSGTIIQGPQGELLSYSISGTGANRKLTLWNSTKAIIEDPANRGGTPDYWSPTDKATVDGKRGIQWSVSIPALPGNPGISLINEGYILASTVDQTAWPIVYIDAAFPATLQQDASGNYPTSISYLWTQNRTNINTHRPSLTTNMEGEVYARWDQATMKIHGYNIQTGQEIWTTNPLPMGWGLFSGGMHIAYGKVYMATYDGHLRAYSTTNGQLVWDYYTGNAGFENAYGTWPAYGFTIADGMIFLTNDEHSPDAVPWRGGKLTAIDAETGDVVWSIDGRLRHTTIADDILTAFNLYDNQIYTFGKGPTKTTVSAPQTVVPLETGVMITGTVTDQTPASKDTPAIADEDMAAWMAYLHMQKPMPATANGVQVKLTAIDPNGNSQNIGTVTSDMGGCYGITWDPPVEGQYQITATFEGSDSYGSSYATTYLAVGPAAAAPQPTGTAQPTVAPTTAPTTAPTASPSVAPPPEAAPSTDIYIIAAAAAVIIVVIAVAVVFLRKRK